jgi:aspartyl-tRNA(Asn)/glutamyl-tRNA(Gln) amidotransferase subunit A
MNCDGNERLPNDPVWPLGISTYGHRLRSRKVTAVAATTAYLERINLLNPRLKAYVHIATEQALQAARDIDKLLAAGKDLGPLMGVPISVKELFKVDGMPVGAGSKIDITEQVGPEGSFIQRLKQAGCIILGTTRSTEFAFTTFNFSGKQPWNPWDSQTHRITGGSSQGAAAAQAAGLSALAFGTDTGGSVRVPASFCGLFGYLPSHGLWPRDGLFPLLPPSDTIGILANSAPDARLVYSTLEAKTPGADHDKNISLEGLCFGKPENHFYQDLDPQVANWIDTALNQLQDAGVKLVPVSVPNPEDCTQPYAKFNKEYGKLFRAHLQATLGKEHFASLLPDMDENTRLALEAIDDLTTAGYIRLGESLEALRANAASAMGELDGWLTPSLPMTAMPLTTINSYDKASALQLRAGRNMSMVNKLGFIATTTPIPRDDGGLPVGLQLIMPNGRDEILLATACAIEQQLGTPPRALFGV